MEGSQPPHGRRSEPVGGIGLKITSLTSTGLIHPLRCRLIDRNIFHNLCYANNFNYLVSCRSYLAVATGLANRRSIKAPGRMER
jgi:hypothetical protein